MFPFLGGFYPRRRRLLQGTYCELNTRSRYRIPMNPNLNAWPVLAATLTPGNNNNNNRRRVLYLLYGGRGRVLNVIVTIEGCCFRQISIHSLLPPPNPYTPPVGYGYMGEDRLRLESHVSGI